MNPSQLPAVCRALLRLGKLEHLWSAAGPTPEARALASGPGLALAVSPQAAAYLCLALALWDGKAGAPLGDFLGRLDGDSMVFVGALLMSIGVGTDAVDRWLEDYGDEPPTGATLRHLPSWLGGGHGDQFPSVVNATKRPPNCSVVQRSSDSGISDRVRSE